jgi:phosphoglycolate phosphatase-like HAD superfamily hydrolase
MNLVIFDVDGTLTETMDVDADCYVRALELVFGFKDVNTDWSIYKQATDSGVLHEICRTRKGRGPSVAEVVQFRASFVKLLTQAWHDRPFAAVRGAAECLAVLASSADYRVSLATGGWRDSARLKLASAGMRYDEYPSASADDAVEREAIIQLSMERAAERYGELGKAIYVGDGVWDARACKKLRMPFVGIGAGERAERLRAEGAACVFSDFKDLDGFLRGVGGAIGAPAATRLVVQRRGRNGMRTEGAQFQI